MQRGYIKLWRAVVDNRDYFSEPFTRSQAWIDLLLLAQYKERTIMIRGIPVVLKRGQVAAGEDFLAQRWKWSRGKVRRFLLRLESNMVQQIVQQKSNILTTITILNWEKYQSNDIDDDTTDNTPSSTASSTTDGQQTDTLKKVKKVKNVKESNTNFLKFWETYPKKIGKGNAERVFLKLSPDDSMFGIIINAVIAQSKSEQWQSDGGKYIPHPATWLNGRRWEDEIVVKNNGHKQELIKSESIDSKLEKRGIKID